VVCLASRAPGDSVRPRRLSGVVVRPLNFTVRVRDKIPLCRGICKAKAPTPRPFAWGEQGARATGAFRKLRSGTWPPRLRSSPLCLRFDVGARANTP
jgi:hypothetical protein